MKISKIIKNHKIIGSNNKSIYLDLYYREDEKPKPVVILVHGFKGFKDWGAFDLMGKYLSDKGFLFLKFNFSHNGISNLNSDSFDDLEGFSQNNYSKELFDLNAVIDFVFDRDFICKNEIDLTKINLIGHSRGGGISLLKTSEDSRISKLVTLASIADFAPKFAIGKRSNIWKQKQFVFIYNSRTKQQMPIKYQFYEDFMANKDRFDIPKSCEKIKIPTLIIHGNSDPTVNISQAENLHKWIDNSILKTIDGADHVFGISHPWEEEFFSKDFEKVMKYIISFL